MNRIDDSGDLHTINNNINSINTTINNMYSMLNIISNSIIVNQLHNIRQPQQQPQPVRPRFNPMSSLFSHINTPNNTTSNNTTSNNTTPINTTPINSTSYTPIPLFTPSSYSVPVNNTIPSEQTPITSTNRDLFTNIFSNILRNEMPHGVGNMGISVMGFSPPDPEDDTLVISHHNIYNNTKIKLHEVDENNEASQCTICLENIEENNIIRKINKCNHSFHIECSDKWFEAHITCPHCRQDIRIEIVD